MNRRAMTALAACLLTTAAWAQSASQPQLNLKLPPNSATSAPASTTQPASASSATAQPNPSAVTINGARPASAPGVYYGDHSGARGNDTASAPACDDSTYNKAQVHGDVGMGVVSASHFGTGSYQSGNVNITQNTGSCDHPTGSMGISIGVSRFGGFNGH
ncbi:hypothetical protein [Dyella acidiphila]|uniref:DUF4150 domain-containing protein n=1 Tax=Dyella acidiphila TaxID=2775866 RepID=A0ABR9GC77_9GAMM|nr:hypothetical protein [Dyella acidiphila]MBE1161658.1 hypothetical protein [Dyella acidiphila]